MTTATLGVSVESLLQGFVRIDSVSDAVTGRFFGERALAEHLETVAAAAGFATRRLPMADGRYNLLVMHEVDAAKPWLLFGSHMDTVAVEGMTVEPFGGEIRDGKLWGRGACDTKGTGAAMLWTLGRYAAQSDRPNNIGILFNVDEECGMSGSRAFATEQAATLGFDIKGVVVGEPTQHRLINAHNGDLRWIVTTAGHAAHSSTPHRGRSAITAMAKVILALETGYASTVTASHPDTGTSAFSINIIEGGSAPNIIPDSCAITIDRRLVPGEDPEQVKADFYAFLDKLGEQDETMKTTVEAQIFNAPPLSPEINKDLAGLVQRALVKCGLPTELQGEPYATDAGDLSQGGIPAVVIGPGNIAQAHTKDEFIELDQLHKGVEVYLTIMNES